MAGKPTIVSGKLCHSLIFLSPTLGTRDVCFPLLLPQLLAPFCEPDLLQVDCSLLCTDTVPQRKKSGELRLLQCCATARLMQGFSVSRAFLLLEDMAGKPTTVSGRLQRYLVFFPYLGDQRFLPSTSSPANNLHRSVIVAGGFLLRTDTVL